jgi:hypothetical protein
MDTMQASESRQWEERGSLLRPLHHLRIVKRVESVKVFLIGYGAVAGFNVSTRNRHKSKRNLKTPVKTRTLHLSEPFPIHTAYSDAAHERVNLSRIYNPFHRHLWNGQIRVHVV